MSELVSIVIPSYNHARFLREAVDSVLRQDYPNVELIVLDDGSTDETHEILASYGDRFRWESQQNMGQSATLAKGWAMARGSILSYLSSDDALLPRAVSMAVEAMRRRPDVSLTYSDFSLISPDSKIIRHVKAPETTWADMVGRLVCAPGPGAFFRRSAYEAAGPWDPAFRKVADFDFFLRLRRAGEFHHIPEVLALFRVHPGSQSYAPMDDAGVDELLTVVNRYFDRGGLPPNVISQKTHAVGRAYLLAARGHFRGGRTQKAFASLRRAWQIDPGRMIGKEGLRIILNALVNRPLHAAYWRVLRFAKGVRGPS